MIVASSAHLPQRDAPTRCRNAMPPRLHRAAPPRWPRFPSHGSPAVLATRHSSLATSSVPILPPKLFPYPPSFTAHVQYLQSNLSLSNIPPATPIESISFQHSRGNPNQIYLFRKAAGGHPAPTASHPEPPACTTNSYKKETSCRINQSAQRNVNTAPG